MSNVTITYHIPLNNLPPATQLQNLQDISTNTLNSGELEMLGLSVVSDDSSMGDGDLLRILVLSKSAQFELENPTDAAKRGALSSLFKQRLNMLLRTSGLTEEITLLWLANLLLRTPKRIMRSLIPMRMGSMKSRGVGIER